jgi:hypothetical protein
MLALFALAGAAATPPPPADEAFTQTLCAVQHAIRWRTPAWDQAKCRRVAGAFQAAGQRHGLSPALLVAISVNESDLREDAVRETRKEGRVHAQDSGLMGIRCLLSPTKRWWRDGRVVPRPERGAKFRQACTNGLVRGMTVKELLVPETNIEVGAAMLARIRDEGVPILETKIVKEHGRPRMIRKVRACQHRNHPWWSHHNWGPKTIESGSSRHYPHRVAVLLYALAAAMDVHEPELARASFVQQPGEKPRKVDKPVGERQRRLFTLILGAGRKPVN